MSPVHKCIDGFPVGKYPRICLLVSGVMKLRSSKSRYMFAWDAKQVLHFAKENNCQLLFIEKH